MTVAGQSKNASAEDAAPEKPAEQPAANGAELKERLDQVGAILAKGLDLAEAGVSLGVSILSRVSVAAQQKMREGLDAAAQPQAWPPGAATEPSTSEAPESEPEYGLTNRLPLAPGGTVKISFSVNNDSMTEVKKVELKVQGFAGDSQAAGLDASNFSIKPAQKTIAPVDFEKFVLQGAVPNAIPPDVYRGVVVVSSDNDLFIPVVLVVTPP
ncbi:MAG TPA: hypothetical protein VGI79_20655 [Caulobacteraceae bacterium]|jgi:hypothetical protein